MFSKFPKHGIAKWLSELFAPATSATYLAKTLKTIQRIYDHSKRHFIEESLPFILSAMANDQQDMVVTNLRSTATDYFDDTPIQQKTWSLGFLSWRSQFLNALKDSHVDFHDSRLSLSQQYFHDKTKEKTSQAFEVLFALNPVLAIQNAVPVGLFVDDIVKAMGDITHYPNPTLYFKCMDAIAVTEGASVSTHLEARLAHHTEAALKHLLEKDIEKFVCSVNKSENNPSAKSHYLHYLPERVRELFLRDQLGKIADAVNGIEDAHIYDSRIFDGLNALSHFVSRGILSEGLDAIKKSVLQRNIKLCFALAAKPTHPDFSPILHQVLQQGTEKDGIRQSSVRNKKNVLQSMIRIENPSVTDDAKDEDKGVQSKYLWILARSAHSTTPPTPFAVAFAAADIVSYLKTQRTHSVDSFPKIKTFESFAGYRMPENIPENV